MQLMTYRFLLKGVFGKEQQGFSGAVYRIAVGSIALGIGVILITYAILFGFQRAINSKIFSVGGHITITKYASTNYYQDQPIYVNPEFIGRCASDARFIGAFPYVARAALLKVDDEVQGVIIKGMEPNAPDYLLKKMLVEGVWWTEYQGGASLPAVVLSLKNARRLGLAVGDTIVCYFAQNPPRARKFIISGLYQSGMDELDEYLVFGNITVMRKLASWSDSLASGLDVYIKDFSQLDTLSGLVYEWMDYDLSLERLTDKFFAVFDWLDLLDQNVRIFLTIVVFVAAFNLASCLIIMVMERTYVLGVLKALGASSVLVYKIFLFKGIEILFLGLIIGNGIALTFYFLQKIFKIIPLDMENYYMDSVPVYMDFITFLVANICWSVLMLFVLVISLLRIKRISAVQALRHD